MTARGAEITARPLVLVMAAALVACSSGAATPGAPMGPIVKVPPRAATAGDRLMALAPAGADLVLEIDMARLRANPVVGPLVERAAGLAGAPAETETGTDLGVLAGADALLFCTYDAGSPDAAMLTLVETADPAAWGAVVAEGVAALGPPVLVARVEQVIAGQEPPLLSDRALMSVRTRAMPARAEGASVRVAARLDFDARVALASQLDLDRVPTAISLWGDVADDLAVVATVHGEDAAEGRDLARALERWRRRVMDHPWVRARYLHLTAGGVDITAQGARVRVVLIIGPRRLQLMTERLSRSLSDADSSL